MKLLSTAMKVLSAPAVAAFLALLLFAPEAGALQCGAGTIRYHPDGDIESCQIEADHEFRTGQGYWITCRAGTIVRQHLGGALKSCVIGKPQAFGGVQCPAAARVRFTPDGSLEGCD